jgi:hypothetical protein
MTAAAFIHARQAMISSASALPKNLQVDALGVVPYSEPKLPQIVVDVHFDPSSGCLPERIARGFARNPIDFISDERNEVSRFAFHMDTELRNMTPFGLAAMPSPNTLIAREVVSNNRGKAQSLHRIPPLGDCLPGFYTGAGVRQRYPAPIPFPIAISG